MNNIYDFRLQDILEKTASSIKQFAENSMMQLKYCALALVFFYAGAYNVAHADDWTGSYGTSITGAGITGSGTETNPYIIDSATKLATVAYLSANNPNATSNKHFSLTVDVDLKNIEWTFGEGKTNSFRGVLNGNGHTISNLSLIGKSSEGNGNDKGYGLFSTLYGNNATSVAKIQNLILSSPSLTINSAGTGSRYYGILVGRVANYAEVENVKIFNPTLTFSCNHNAQWNVSAGIGYIGAYAHVKNILVTSPTITTSGSLTMAKQTRFSVGGAIGYLDATGTAVNNGFMQANYADHIVVTNGNIDLSGYTPASKSGNLYNLRYDYFFVGGVIGQHKNPQKLCENIFFSGKIKSPFSTVAPCMGAIGGGDDTQMLSMQFSCEAYTGRTYDMVEGSKSSTWYYNNFKIGLDPTIIAAAEAAGKIKNYHSSNVDGENYLNVTPKTLKRHNRVEATPRQSYTVLWWTRNNNTNTASVAPADSAEWTDGEQYIYPRYDQNVTQYPSYYMYYAQGVNAGTQYLDATAATAFVSGVTKNIDNAMGANTPKDITLTVTDLNKGQRGFGKHTFSVAAEGDDVAQINHYKWYVNGVDEGAGNTKDVTPTFDKTRGYQLGSGVLVYAYDSSDNILAQAAGDLPVARLRFKNSDSAGTKSDGPHTYVYDAGTKEHPYLIGCEEDLRLLSEHIRQNANIAQEYIYFSNGLNSGNKCRYNSNVGNRNDFISYNQAYYEMDGNVEMSSTPFLPIGPNSAPVFSSDGTDGNRNNNFSFVGSFDGKGYKIKGLRQKWYAGYANDNNSTYAWGLFSCIGSPNQYYKVGETTASNAAVRNLIIDDAVLTHDTSNTSFYYNNGSASSRGNHCFVGPLAGIAGNYSTIENISVINSTITDDGSSEYKLAAKRLSIGGVIGRATAGIVNDNSSLANAKMRYLSSDANIDIRHAEFTNLTTSSQIQLFNIGGIVGSLHSSAAHNTVPFPTPSFYSGKVRARNAIIGPIFGYASWSGYTGTGYLDFASHFTAKTSAAATFDATGMYYSSNKTDGADQPGFRIYNGTTYKAINDEYPSVTSDWGDRNIKGVSTHTNTNVYTEDPKDLYEYQGVNQGNYEALLSPTVITAFNDYSSLLTDEQTLLEDYKWAWSTNAASQPVVTIGEVSGLYVTAKDTYDGSTVTDHILEATVNSASEGERSYQWYKKVRIDDEDQDVAIDGATAATYKAIPGLHNQYIFVRATIGEDHADSDVILVSKTDDITASASKTGSEGNWTLSADLSLDPTTSATTATLTSAGFNITYQWYKGQVGYGEEIDGATSATLNVTTEETTMRYCVVTVTDPTVHSDYAEANTWRFTVNKLPANVMVVYLDPAGSGNDSNNGITPATAVKSWHKAYSLLSDGGSWDDNIVVLMSESNGDRTIEGFRLDMSLEAQYTEGSYEGWYSRTHDGIDAYWPSAAPAGYTTGMSNSHLWKNATITGKWEDHDYTSSAKITFKSDRDFIGLNGDTKFENLTFRGHAYGSVGGSSYDIFFCQYHSVEFGDGLKMEYIYADGSYGHMAGSNTPDFEVFGGFNGDARFRHDTNGFLGNEWDKYFPHGKEGFTITFKSGHFGVVCASHRQAYWTAQGMSGTPNMPVKCKIVVDMDRTWNDTYKSCIGTGNGTNADYDIGLILAGNHEGAMYGDVDINVYSGHVARIANGTLGALRQWYGYAGICQPGNAYFGRANALLDPSLSRFATPGETSAEKNERIIITEIYGGGLGRDLGATGMIFIPFYGKSSVTMNGGTFKLLPEGNTHDAEGEVFPGIFATGAGGVNGMYHYDDPIAISGSTSDPQVYPSSQRLPYWDTDKGNGVVWGGNGTTGGLVRYGNWSTYSSMTGARKVYVHCYNADTDDFTDLDPEDSQATVTINDGIFGTSTKPIDGIYGGGSGYTPTYILKNSTSAYPNYRSGNIYGKEGADHPVATLTINGGEFYCKNGIFAGGRGTDHYYKTNRTNSGSDAQGAWYGNYTGLGQIYGDVELNITGGTFHDNGSTYFGNIFGGGLGFGDVMYNSQAATKKTLKDMARIYGTTTMNISGGTFEGNIYGGGAIANVGYGTSSRESKHYSIGNKNAVTMNITGGVVKGKVFGAAMGKTNVEVTQAPDSIGNVFGNVNLTIKGDTIGGDIYGGAEKGDVYGSVTANVSGAAIAGDIYGGGMGVLSGETVTASADVRGNTFVTLGAGTSYVTASGSYYVKDSSTAHYVYGGGNLASVIGTYTGTPVSAVVSGGNTTVNINNGMGTAQLSVYGAGYGANTYCNMTNVNINNFDKTSGTGVSFKHIGLKEVYGGGNEGSVYTNTTVNVNGGQVFGNVFGGGNLADVGTLSAGTYPYEPFGTMVSLANTEAYIYGNIYGGGNQANVKGNSQVSVSMGSFAGEIFGGGKGVMTSNDVVGTSADIIGQTSVYVNGAHVIWDKLWDWDTANSGANKRFRLWDGTTGDTNANLFLVDKNAAVPVFRNNHNIYAGGELACVVTDTARVEVTNGAVPSSLIKKDVWKKSFSDDANPHFYVFGGGYGPFTQVKDTEVKVGVEGYYSDDEDESTNEQWALDIPIEGMNETTSVGESGGDMGIFGNNYGIGGYTVLGVIGGGYAGLVKNNTDVTLGGTTFVHRVYGGGYGQFAAYNSLATATRLDYQTNQTRSIITSSKTRENLGEVGGNTRVTVGLSKPDDKGRTGGVYGDVFGGGAGVESAAPTVQGTHNDGTITDFVDMGKVLGVTRVDVIENARVYGNVYGGGDVANVANSAATQDSVTVVKLRGGDIFGDVFGGGKGRIYANCVDYTTLGNVTGNSYVVVRDSVKVENEESVTIATNIWGNVYGGGQVGDVKKTSGTRGNAFVSIDGGNIGGDIYGAGYGDITEGVQSSADVEGNTQIIVNGGSFLWKQASALDGNIKTLTEAKVDMETAHAILNARNSGEPSAELQALQNNFADVFDYDNNCFVKDHNIYGGGNTVSVVTGNANITVNHGMLNDDVAYYDDKNWNLSSLLTQLVTNHNSHPQFSVLGGGYGINTRIGGNANVNVQVGKSDVEYAYKEADSNSWNDLFDLEDGVWKTEYDALPTATKDRYYGGSSGTNGIYRYITSRLANCFSIPNHTFMDIVGGGMAGLVTGNTNVTVSDQSMCQNIIGGGIGIVPESPTGTETYGQVGGTATVSITGAIVAGNVYGGGAGVESVDTNSDGTPDIDFTEIGAVDKTTSVTIDGTPSGTVIFGKVYGGGDIADIKNTDNVEDEDATAAASTVLIKGGCVYQQVFAGGSGRIASECVDYRRLGKVYGNTKVTIQDNETPANNPWLWNRVYGGGSYGSVAKNPHNHANSGHTYVNITGGNLGYNIFGAGLGDVRTINDVESVTNPTVAGDTHVNISGGEWCISQMWNPTERNWEEATGGTSSQFDEVNEKFKINHNIYGGGNAASEVMGHTYVNMTKGLLKGTTSLGREYSGTVFEQTEWEKIYNKVGSFHFSVIGGGYGDKTQVDNDTHVTIDIPAASVDGGQEISTSFIEKSEDVLKENMYTLFKSQQSVLDVIGGGYNGKVLGDTHVTISGDPYMRRIFGGSFYADVNNTYVQINSACADDVFGGGMMGDVKQTANLTFGAAAAATNNKILICRDVYGGNDVSGQIDGLVSTTIHGGKFYRNVYGAGNGNYLYALNEDRAKVTTMEDYESDGETYDLVYEVPRRTELMPASASSASEAARLVNINSFRPLAQYISLDVTGSASTPVKILGNLFGGGNTATVTKLDETNDPAVTVNIGDYVTASQVFMGSDGEAMFDESSNGFLNAFRRINEIEFSHGINWANDPYNKAIPEKYLPLDLDERQKTFQHIIDLYFQPVEMSVQPTLKWNGTVATTAASIPSMTGTTIGSFFCGGNRGNMDVTPKSGGNVVDYIFPAGLTIKDKIVGGCNNANFTREDLGVVHQGGYLLGSRSTTDPMIKFKVAEGCNIKPYSDGDTYTGGNIYGGCYKSGTINGDIHIDVHSNMLDGLGVDKLKATNDAGIAAGNIYGAGFGTDSYVYGDIEVAFGTSARACTQNTASAEPLSLNIPIEGEAPVNRVTDAVTTYDDTGFSANSIFGGGELGNVIGNTTVKVLNGHLAGDVCGGSYAGVQYGSTHVLVGYPNYYEAKESGNYLLNRADKRADNNALRNYGGSKVIKDTIRLIEGDYIAPCVYDSIIGRTPAMASKFTARSITAPVSWGNISIQIDKAIYGGGYALTSGYSGSGGTAGTYTVRKYNDTYNVNNSMSEEDPLYNATTAGYGGNTTVLVWENDYASTGAEHEHITISNETDEGGFYGGGHLSYAEGFRAGELKGYGYANHRVVQTGGSATEVNGAKVMNTIQRLDVMRLTDNCLILNGARDYTINDVSTTPYSIARVGELQMVSTIDKTAALATDSTTLKYRNYLGLMNNIHYVGAISSDHLFTDDFHNAKGVKTAGTSYKAKKQEYITNWYAAYPDGAKTPEEISKLSTDDANAYRAAKSTFNERNSATARNLIGLSSGYAMKVQNTKVKDAAGTDSLFYGPIVGVVEMKLILPIVDEGGGYVYADNVHDPNKSEFLETTGNFVFPIQESRAHFVVDDCLMTNFDDMTGDRGSTRNADESEIHYWFLTGVHYIYNLHITGYTYDSSTTPITFHADTSDGLTILEGAEGNGANPLKITSVTWNHYGKKFGEAEPNSLYDDDILNGEKDYTLKLSASYSAYTAKDEDVENGKAEVGDVKTLYNEDGLYANITRNANTESDQALTYTGDAPTLIDPKLAICLVDHVNNAGSAYYADHLAKPDTVQIEMASGSGYTKTYTINLIINYVKGPSYTGNLEVVNCALPGEYIKIRKDGITIDADESFAQNGEFLRIGKRNNEGTSLLDGYMTYDASGERTSEMLQGKVYSDPAGKYLMIPAYYFMNGYGVQYVFTCNNMESNGIPTEFDVAMRAQDTLLVHNYHRMDPHTSSGAAVDLRLTEAVARAQQETSTFAEPRIYLRDARDMQAFQAFIDTVGVNIAKVKLSGYADSLAVPTAGRYAQFFLQNDITVQQENSLADRYYTAPANFAGVLHGDGYSVKGIDLNLIDNLAATGEVYNLGLPSGTIAGTIAEGGKIRTSFEANNRKVYNLNGEAETYTEADFNDGKVAYNLNQYYLEARKKMITTPATTQAALADEASLSYMKSYYENGDYQYARQYNATTGTEYLRTNDIPHYTVDVMDGFDVYTSYHKTTHDIDVARAVDKDEQGDYRPLFNAEKVDAESDATVVKNDYIFFGQGLQAEPDYYPSVIASHIVADMDNRVYRASGFYQSKVDQGFHFNANQLKTIDTYVHNPKTTAIDFTGKRDAENATLLPATGWITPETTGIVGAQKIFYAPAKDMPSTSHAIEINAGVTKNLLMYTDAITGDAPYSMAELTDAKIRYNNSTDEDEILGHQITGTPETTYSAAHLHLVDMEDFNAPIEFTADTAWYVRNPETETGYVNEAGKAWSSICLPFSVKYATLSEGLIRHRDAFGNGQVGTQTLITYFYGDADDKASNPNILNHEFWLRRLTAVDAGTAKATFKRPTRQIGHTMGFTAYKPFIVSFPGEQFYEFDMTGQTITFGARDATVKVTDVAVADSATTANGYHHYGAFLNNDGDDSAYAINVGGHGEAFEKGQALYPFRSYLTTGSEIKGNSMNMDFNAQSSRFNGQYIYIDDTYNKLEEVLDGDIDKDPDGGVTTSGGLHVYGVGQRIIVVSDYATTLPVYTVTGALVRVLDVLPGKSTYSGFKQGIYVVDQKKIRLR